MSNVNPKAFPLANAQLTQQILDIVQQGTPPSQTFAKISVPLQATQEGRQRNHKNIESWTQRVHRHGCRRRTH